MLRYNDGEYAQVVAAAHRAQLTASGYAAACALAAAADRDSPVPAPAREALLELMAARTQLRRFAVNVNQAVRELNATGEAPLWLAQAVELTSRAVARVDEAAARLAASSRAWCQSRRRATSVDVASGAPARAQAPQAAEDEAAG